MDYVLVVLILGLVSLWFVGTKALYWASLLAVIIFVGCEPGLLFWLIYIPLNIVLLVPSIRQELISRHLVALVNKLHLMPSISQTEKTALRAGTIWIDGEFFSGKPSFDTIFKESYPKLSPEEQDFLDNEVNTVCKMTDDWTVFKERDLSKEVWKYLKEKRFFGMIIPKE